MYVGFTTENDSALEIHVDHRCMTVTVYDCDRDVFMQAEIKGEEMEALYWYIGEVLKAKRQTQPDRRRDG